MSNVLVLEKEKCTGCGACFNICPSGAISMQENNEGFLYPEIDEEKCTDCGLCAKSCACLNPKYENRKNPECYAFMASDEERMKSSSGAAFPVLAYEFIKNGGYVSGAVWNNDFGVEHIVSNNPEDIEKMRGSKYLQSDTKHCYTKIKELLNTGEKVLFTGCPCQVAGLKKYLQKDYENLFCIDIICHGVPSPKVFKKYVEEEILQNDGEKWINTNFRDKISGWNNSSITTKTTKNTGTNSIQTDTFMQAFLKNICLRQSCAVCQFATLPRQGDITIGDFWKIKNFRKKYDDKKGTSVVLLNNKKGRFLSKILKEKSILYKSINIKHAIIGNPNLIKPSVFHKNRKNFFLNIDKMLLRDNVDRNLNNKCDIMIINFWYAVNYGASLTCYGVQCLIEKLGLFPKVINYIPDFSKTLKYKGSFSEAFAKKYLNLTKKCNTYKDFRNLNNDCSTFIVGSDQVFSPSIIKSHHTNVTKSIYLLDFVDKKNKKLTYAASLGDFKKNAKYEDLCLFNHFLQQFDDISVRENDAVDILKDYFNINSCHLIDGAFHIPKNILYNMTNISKTDEEYIAYYGLPYSKNKWELPFVRKISKMLNIPLKEMTFDSNISVENWLSFIKHSKIVISDSYHSIIFAIIFNIPFIRIVNPKYSQNRFNSLFKKLDIEDSYITENCNDIFDKILLKRNWEEINLRISEEVKKAENWLKKALEKPVKDKSQYDSLNYLFIKQQLDEEQLKNKLKLLVNKEEIYKKYYRYKILSKILFGKKRKHYKQKRVEYKSLIKKLRHLKKM